MDADLLTKARAQVGAAEVAYLDAGAGPEQPTEQAALLTDFLTTHAAR
jgi:hypothetical protein